MTKKHFHLLLHVGQVIQVGHDRSQEHVQGHLVKSPAVVPQCAVLLVPLCLRCSAHRRSMRRVLKKTLILNY